MPERREVGQAFFERSPTGSSSWWRSLSRRSRVSRVRLPHHLLRRAPRLPLHARLHRAGATCRTRGGVSRPSTRVRKPSGAAIPCRRLSDPVSQGQGRSGKSSTDLDRRSPMSRERRSLNRRGDRSTRSTRTADDRPRHPIRKPNPDVQRGQEAPWRLLAPQRSAGWASTSQCRSGDLLRPAAQGQTCRNDLQV